MTMPHPDTPTDGVAMARVAVQDSDERPARRRAYRWHLTGATGSTV
jgi:hypothetical protein